METQIQEYSPTVAVLASLTEQYKGVVYDVTIPIGMDAARKARAEIRGYRTGLETKRIEIKAPALERCQLIDAEAKRITAVLAALENPIDTQIKVEESRKERERQVAIRADQARIEAEQLAIRESQEKKFAEERAEIARRQAILDRAEHERVEAERQTRLKIEADERAARERIEAVEREARQKRQIEEDRLRSERESLDKTRRDQEERERVDRLAKEQAERTARLAEETKQREIERLKTEVMDAYDILTLFTKRYGHFKEFASIIKAIKAFLEVSATA